MVKKCSFYPTNIFFWGAIFWKFSVEQMHWANTNYRTNWSSLKWRILSVTWTLPQRLTSFTIFSFEFIYRQISFSNLGTWNTHLKIHVYIPRLFTSNMKPWRKLHYIRLYIIFSMCIKSTLKHSYVLYISLNPYFVLEWMRYKIWWRVKLMPIMKFI